jgi:hypothetical protein
VIVTLGRRLKSGQPSTINRVMHVGPTVSGNQTEWSRLLVALGGPDSFMRADKKWDFNKVCQDLQDDIFANSYNLCIKNDLYLPKAGYRSGQARTRSNHHFGLVSIQQIKHTFQTRADLDGHLTYSDFCLKEFGVAIREQSHLPAYRDADSAVVNPDEIAEDLQDPEDSITDTNIDLDIYDAESEGTFGTKH